LDALLAYIAGDTRFEKAAVEELRTLGAAAARARGFSALDADEVGVDFAACLLAGEWTTLTSSCAGGGHLDARVRLAARWYALRAWRMRLRITEREIALEPGAQGDVPVPRSGADSCVAVVTAWIGGRPAKDRLLYELCIIEGDSCAAAAKALGCTPAAARKRLERLRSQLRELLKESERLLEK
jgi:DNA-directed RNA polymerase specialized sigma24 family protein